MNENQAMMLERSMRSVFVGNIPFDMTDEKLKEIFSEVGPVLSFKLVYDRENGKPKGYGFCEYKDIETANSAMRNLNGYEISGRVLKVDNAANEKTRVELQNALSEPIVENAFEHLAPEKVPEAISKAVASLPPEQMFELMKQMKQCIQNNPHEARAMLLQNPQLAFGLLQSLVVMKIVDPEIALTMLAKPNSVPDLMNPEPRPVQPPQDPQMHMNHNMGPFMNPNIPPMNQNMPPMNQNMPPMNQNMPPGNQNMPPMNNMPPQMNVMNNMPPQMNMMNQNMPPQMNQMNSNMPPQINSNMPPQMNQPPMMGNNDMDRQMDPRGRLMGGPPPLPPMGIGSGDVDLRTQMPMPVPAPVMPPLPNSLPPDPTARDPRGDSRQMNQPPPLPVAPPRDPRPVDPRSGAGTAHGAPPPLPRQPPPLPKQKASSSPMAGMAGMMGEAVGDQEKAALIMQVLQLTNEQISMLPAEQRQSILLLKEQIAKSSQR